MTAVAPLERRSTPETDPSLHPVLKVVSTPSRRLRLVGLFAGIGGIEIGLSDAGHRTRLLCEIDEAARVVLAQHAGSKPMRKDVRRMRSLPPCDLLAGGFPCQDLSQAGRTAGIEGANSGLV